MFDQLLKHAFAARPSGYYVVRDGEIRPDDLLWSVMERKWRRADDETWLSPAPIDAELAFCVIRKARYERAPGQSERRYVLNREREPISQPQAPERPHEQEQPDLFA